MPPRSVLPAHRRETPKMGEEFFIKSTYGTYGPFTGSLEDAKTTVKAQLGMHRMPKGYSVESGPVEAETSTPVPAEWELIEKVIPHTSRMLIWGPPGPGKTYYPNHYNLMGRTVYNCTLHEESDPSMLLGHYFLNDKGSFEWKDGIITRAWREGSRLVLNEISRTNGATMSALLGALDDPEFARMTLDSGETISPAEGFQVVATDNYPPEDLPDALRDRFEVIVEVHKPHPDAIAKLPADLRRAATGTVGRTDNPLSLRDWIAFAKLREKVGEDWAARAVFPNNWKDVLQSLKIGKGVPS